MSHTSRRFAPRIMPAARRGTPMSWRRLRTCRVCGAWRALYRGVCRDCTDDLARAANATSTEGSR